MDYREYLKNPVSLRYIDKLVQEINLHPTDFNVVYKLIFDTDLNVAWRAAWACQKISENHTDWFTNKHFNELETLTISTNHGGLRRGCLSILNNLTIPQPLSVNLLNACFDWLNSSKSPIAVQALSLKLLKKFCEVEPDLKLELFAFLDNYMSNQLSPGIITVRKNIIKSLLNK